MNRRIGLRPGSGDSFVAWSIFVWMVAIICSAIPLETRVYSGEVPVGFLPLVTALLGSSAAIIWRRMLGRIEWRRILPVAISLGIAIGLYLYSAALTSYSEPKWLLQFIYQTSSHLYSKPIEYQSELITTVVTAAVTISIGIAAIKFQPSIQKLLDLAWKYRTRVGVTLFSLMMLPASVSNASYSSNIPSWLMAFSTILATLAGIPTAILISLWLIKVSLLLPVRWFTSSNLHGIKVLLTVVLVSVFLPLLVALYWEDWLDLFKETSWLLCAVIPSFLGSVLLLLPYVAYQDTPKDESATSLSVLNPIPTRYSLVTVVSLSLFGVFCYSAVYRYDLGSLLVFQEYSSTKILNDARNLKRLRLESQGSCFPVDESTVVIRTSANDTSDCLEVLTEESITRFFSTLIFDLNPRVDLAPIQHIPSIQLISGDISPKQLKQLETAQQLLFGGISLPEGRVDELQLKNFALTKTPDRGLPETLLALATPARGVMAAILCDIKGNEDWEAIVRASTRRDIVLDSSRLPTWVLNSQLPASVEHHLILFNFDRQNPQQVRFALKNGCRIGSQYQAFGPPFDSCRSPLDLCIQGFDLIGIDRRNGQFENELAIYERDEVGEPIAYCNAGGALHSLDQFPKIEVARFNGAPPLLSPQRFYINIDQSQFSYKTLRELYFSSFQFLSDSEFRLLEGMPNLEVLQLGFPPAPDYPLDWVSKLDRLRILRMFNLPESSFCSELSKLDQLKRIEIYVQDLELMPQEKVDSCKQILSGKELVMRDLAEYSPEVPANLTNYLQRLKAKWIERLDALTEPRTNSGTSRSSGTFVE